MHNCQSTQSWNYTVILIQFSVKSSLHVWLTWIAYIRLFPSPAIEARRAVVVVPRLDPKVNGYDLSTEIIPIPIKRVKEFLKIIKKEIILEIILPLNLTIVWNI